MKGVKDEKVRYAYGDESGDRSHLFINCLHCVIDQFCISNIAFIRLDVVT